jgi:hypothetical protein
MTFSEISCSRLINQQIPAIKCATVKDLVSYMCAMQAQDYSMAKWAIGVRLSGSTESMVENSIRDGQIIRTHVLRPTWHFISADDIHWMHQLTAPGILNRLKSRHYELELTAAILKKSFTLMEKALRGGIHRTREEMAGLLIRAGIATDNNRMSHLLLRAELEGILCSGATRGNKTTYALLSERILKTNTLHKDEALSLLAQKYFISRFPATLQDFVWWSGISVTEAKRALEMNRSCLFSEKIGEQTYFRHESSSTLVSRSKSLFLLPAFDELLLSYKDRSAILPPGKTNIAISSNGIFRPVIVVNGRVIGTWKRSINKNTVGIETNFFRSPDKTVRDRTDKAADRYGQYLNKRVEICHKSS